MRSLLVASNRLFQTRVLPGWPPPWGQPWPSGLKAQPGFPRPPTARRVAMAWHAREPGREEACNREEAQQGGVLHHVAPNRFKRRSRAALKKKLFVLRPSSLVFVLVDLVVLRIHVRRITARGACSSEVAVDAAPLLLDRVVSSVPSSLSIVHLSLSPSLLLSLTLSVYVYMCRCILYMYMYVCLYIFMHV